MAGLLARLFGQKAQDISPQEAYKRYFAVDEPALIVDVRQPVEYRAGTIPGAMLIPLTELGQRMAELPQKRQILTICRSSHRSPIAARQLKKAGYDVLNVSGGMQGWEMAGLPLKK
jgi:rhodanese-related sulfurtransferase